MKPVAPVTKYAMAFLPVIARPLPCFALREAIGAARARVADCTVARTASALPPATRAPRAIRVDALPTPRLESSCRRHLAGRRATTHTTRKIDMLKKARAERDAAADKGGEKELAKSVLDSSRQIWLAGLGAFSRAPAE
jgi:hypothetical protein